MSLYLIPLIAPIALLFAGLFALTSPGLRPAILPRLAQIAALIALAAACSGAVLVVLQGPDTGSLLGVGGIGISVRLDVVTATMLILVAFIGWVVLRY